MRPRRCRFRPRAVVDGPARAEIRRAWPAGGTRARWPAGAPAREPGLEIRFSARCDAAWARIWQTRVGDRVEITALGSPLQRAAVADKFDAGGGVALHADGPGTTALGAARLPHAHVR
ncbi:DUF2690 domain-containing protein [Streptomyces sp. NPDC056464]|uniref:DUF2690 domain-containing protein n=1 Tax=Streptomyces sp. NPDC056464 TaxID=3345828 RepID=UPI0036A282ED